MSPRFLVGATSEWFTESSPSETFMCGSSGDHTNVYGIGVFYISGSDDFSSLLSTPGVLGGVYLGNDSTVGGILVTGKYLERSNDMFEMDGSGGGGGSTGRAAKVGLYVFRDVVEVGPLNTLYGTGNAALMASPGQVSFAVCATHGTNLTQPYHDSFSYEHQLGGNYDAGVQLTGALGNYDFVAGYTESGKVVSATLEASGPWAIAALELM